MRGWFKAYSPESTLTIDNKPYAVTPHLIASDQTNSTSYALISDSGKALFVDYGLGNSEESDLAYIAPRPPHARKGFFEHTLTGLKASYGCSRPWMCSCRA